MNMLVGMHGGHLLLALVAALFLLNIPQRKR